jgi:mannose-6-phosphate isomerase-like protein (cupin superfamily)
MEFKSVSSDERREILANTELLPEGKEVSIIKLNKGKAIGGCIHNKDEYWTILSGCVIVVNGIENTVAMAPDSGTFYMGTPHAFFAEEDSIIIEYGITPEEKQRNKKDTELLTRVNKFNEVHTLI